MHPLFHPLFVDYCSYFNGNQDYFECHEVLEEYWKKIAPSVKKHPLVGYIQLATGMYHWRRHNFTGSLRLLSKAHHNFIANKGSEYFDCIDFDHLVDCCIKAIAKVEQDCPFYAFQLPIINQDLNSIVDKKIKELPNNNDSFLLNKHMLRDRSDILNARELKRNKKSD